MPFALHLFQVTFIRGIIGTIKIVHETSLQKTEPNIMQPRVIASFSEGLDSYNFHVILGPTMLGRKMKKYWGTNGDEGCICMHGHYVGACRGGVHM